MNPKTFQLNSWMHETNFFYLFIYGLSVADSTTSIVCPALSLMPNWKQDNQMQNAAGFESKLSALTVFFVLQSKPLSHYLLMLIKIRI